MTMDTYAEEEAILQRLRSNLWDGRVWDELPDETERATDAETGMVLPDIVLTFGTPFPSARDRSIEGAAQQPHILPFVAECFGATKDQARAGASGVIKYLNGWIPTGNASEIELTGGGGGYPNYDQGRPVRFRRAVAGMCVINLSIDDAL